MVIVNFTLTPSAVGHLHDAFACLSKFSDSVSIEARSSSLALTALNTSRTTYASFVLDAPVFFSQYEFSGANGGRDDRFTCQIYNKALLSVFKSRPDDAKGKDGAIERCEVSIEDRPDKVECRLMVTMVCRHGVTKIYRLTYEPTEVMHALFDKNAASNVWTISSRLLKEYIEHFGSKTEQLDIYSEEHRATFTSYTEKIQDGKEILKQPLQTSVSIDTQSFDVFKVEDHLHIAISVKDFRAIVTHADTMKKSLTARYSQPTRPLQFNYGMEGMQCEFTLMTIGDFRGTPAPSITRGQTASSQQTSRTSHATSVQSGPRSAQSDMPPPAHPASRTSARLRQRTASAKVPSVRHGESRDSEGLFVAPGDEDRQWDPTEYRDDDEEMLRWDATDNDRPFQPTFQDSGTRNQSQAQTIHRPSQVQGVEPTQRVAEIRGLFDE